MTKVGDRGPRPTITSKWQRIETNDKQLVTRVSWLVTNSSNYSNLKLLVHYDINRVTSSVRTNLSINENVYKNIYFLKKILYVLKELILKAANKYLHDKVINSNIDN